MKARTIIIRHHQLDFRLFVLNNYHSLAKESVRMAIIRHAPLIPGEPLSTRPSKPVKTYESAVEDVIVEFAEQLGHGCLREININYPIPACDFILSK